MPIGKREHQEIRDLRLHANATPQLLLIPKSHTPLAELRREGRLTRIAKAFASGATVTEIAKAEGISRTLASREVNSPECREAARTEASREARAKGMRHGPEMSMR